MSAGKNILISVAALGASGGFLYDAGYDEQVCQPIAEFADWVDNPDTSKKVSFGPCDKISQDKVTALSNGRGRVALSSEIGDIIQFTAPQIKQKANFTPDAFMFGYADVVRTMQMDYISVDWQASADEGLIIASEFKDGENVGLNASTIHFEEKQFEYDIADGVDDEKCSLPAESPNFRGCYYGEYFDQGISIIADTKEKLVRRYMTIFSLKASDEACLMQYAIPNSIRETLGEYDIEIENNEEGANKAAKILATGFIKEQLADALNIPVQLIVAPFDPDEKYNYGKTYAQRLDSNGTLGDLTDSDNGDDWCISDVGGSGAVILAEKRLQEITLSAISPDGWNYKTKEFDYNDTTLRRPSSYQNYPEPWDE